MLRHTITKPTWPQSARNRKWTAGWAVWAVLLALLLALPAVAPVPAGAFAGQSVVRMPRAETIGEGAALFTVRLLDGDLGAAVIYGLSDSLDLGVSAAPLNGGKDTEYSPALQLNIWQETPSRPAVAVGYRDHFGYVTLGRQLGRPGLRGHIGVRTDPTRPFGAISYVLNPVQVVEGDGVPLMWTLLAEYDGQDINGGVRVETGRGLYGEVGWASGGFLAGVGYKTSL